MKDNGIKSFSIDFNWYDGVHAPKNMFRNADAGAWVEWYKELGCNNFWTFAMSYNGYAWFPSETVPKITGLQTNFVKNCCDLGHANAMTVFAYLCFGANPQYQRIHPELFRPSISVCPEYITAIYNDRYIDYFISVCLDVLGKAPLDGLVFDWFRGATVKRPVWSDIEKELYEKIMGEKFPKSDPDADVIARYDFLTLEYAWKKIRAALSSYIANGLKLWTNQPFDKINDPVWKNHILLKEADYILNESPDVTLLEWLGAEVGENTTIVQNYCGWIGHDIDKMSGFDKSRYGKFGFAAADPDTCLPTERMSPENFRNIVLLKELFLA
ncbi:MAG: hypothetical protein FWE62_06390 [Firmicutes bacterium]|nr:hypothetical protein [Bacillota bacterium]